MFKKMGKILIFIFILFFSCHSKLSASPCTDWDLLLPPAREDASMAFDATTNQTILFGGFGNGQQLNDTWSWDGTKWTQLFPSTSPSIREGAALAFDATTNQLILFGGSGNSGNLNDTWSFDGTTWTQLSPASSPPARSGATMAFDVASSQLILFGGFGFSGNLNDTWYWDGTNWSQLSPATIPPARSNATMAYDSINNILILFGGFENTRANDTWSWDGIDWTLLSPTTSPPARSNAVMASNNSLLNQMILFGGIDGGGNTVGDTWNWDGTTMNWIQQSPTTSPPARFNASMALDVNNKLILFGGLDGATFGDTWSWNGTDWVILSNPPSPRSNASMAFDTTTSQLIFFGGAGFSGLFNDTFNWDGIAWTQLAPLNPPPARAGASMAFDSATNQLILFGGFGNSGVLNDTWNWDGLVWNLLPPSTSPSVRSNATMAFDPSTNQLILFGGFDNSGNSLNDTWNWNGTTWTQLSPPTSPPVRGAASMAFDTATNQMILFGGFNTTTGSFLNDTWIWDGTTWTELFPPNSPPVREFAVMAFDLGTNQIILFGGDNNSGGLRDTWSWDGNTWTKLFPSTFPIFSDQDTMAFDTATSQMILVDTTGNTWNWSSFPAFFAIATPSSEIISSGSTTSIVISANVPGATFSWTASAVGVSGASNGTGSSIDQTLTTNSSSTGTVIYIITPTSPSGCQGSPITVIVTVESGSSLILPPTHVKGFKACHCRCIINIIKWQPPASGEPPAYYRIYRNAKLTWFAGEIFANQKLVFKDTCQNSCKTHKYWIVSVDNLGNQSSAASVTIKNKRRCR